MQCLPAWQGTLFVTTRGWLSYLVYHYLCVTSPPFFLEREPEEEAVAWTAIGFLFFFPKNNDQLPMISYQYHFDNWLFQLVIDN